MESKATLRIVGEALLPDEVTRVLGCTPTHARRKGDIMRGKRTGRERISPIGIWYLDAEARDPADLERQIAEILDRVTPDLGVWAELSRTFHVDLFCGPGGFTTTVTNWFTYGVGSSGPVAAA